MTTFHSSGSCMCSCLAGGSARDHLTDQIRRIRHEEARDPIAHAFYAIAALSNAQRAVLAIKFNAVFKDRPNAQTLTFTGLES